MTIAERSSRAARRFETAPRRVLSLLPSATEIVAALGCADRLVGRSHECDFPAGVEALPVCTQPRIDVSGTSAEIDARIRHALKDALAVYDVERDRLRALDPDLIVTQSQCDVCAVSLAAVEASVAELLDREIPIVSLEPMRLSDLGRDILNVARALGVEGEGETLAATIERRWDAVRRATKDVSERPRVAALEWTDPLMTGGTWIPELIEIAGGTDPFGRPGAHAATIDWSRLVQEDPDVIVLMPCGFGLERARAEARTLARHPGWPSLSAVRAGRVYAVDASSYFSRPGPRLAESAEILMEILHPERSGIRYRGRGFSVAV